MKERLEIAMRIFQGKPDIIHADVETQQSAIIEALQFADMMIDIEDDADMWRDLKANNHASIPSK